MKHTNMLRIKKFDATNAITATIAKYCQLHITKAQILLGNIVRLKNKNKKYLPFYEMMVKQMCVNI